MYSCYLGCLGVLEFVPDDLSVPNIKRQVSFSEGTNHHPPHHIQFLRLEPRQHNVSERVVQSLRNQPAQHLLKQVGLPPLLQVDVDLLGLEPEQPPPRCLVVDLVVECQRVGYLLYLPLAWRGLQEPLEVGSLDIELLVGLQDSDQGVASDCDGVEGLLVMYPLHFFDSFEEVRVDGVVGRL